MTNLPTVASPTGFVTVEDIYPPEAYHLLQLKKKIIHGEKSMVVLSPMAYR